VAVTPDIDGFLDAESRFQDAFGRTVTFVTLGSVTFPPGTQIDPETEKPYDPTITGSAAPSSSAAVKAIVVTQPLTGSHNALAGEVTVAAIGEIELGQAILIIEEDEWEPSMAEADWVEVFSERYDIVREDEDGIAEQPAHRHIVVIQQL